MYIQHTYIMYSDQGIPTYLKCSIVWTSSSRSLQRSIVPLSEAKTEELRAGQRHREYGMEGKVNEVVALSVDSLNRLRFELASDACAPDRVFDWRELRGKEHVGMVEGEGGGRKGNGKGYSVFWIEFLKKNNFISQQSERVAQRDMPMDVLPQVAQHTNTHKAIKHDKN